MFLTLSPAVTYGCYAATQHDAREEVYRESESYDQENVGSSRQKITDDEVAGVYRTEYAFW